MSIDEEVIDIERQINVKMLEMEANYAAEKEHYKAIHALMDARGTIIDSIRDLQTKQNELTNQL